MFSRFFINRPIFASVLSIVIVLAGSIALFTLPVAQYPEIAPPTVEVSASYPGANAQVVADTVAAPIEQQVNGVEGMMYMSSQCTNDGNYTLTVTFKPGSDLNISQVLVQNRESLAEPILPDLVKRRGISVKKKSPNVLMIVNLFSKDDSRNNLELSNYATIQIRDELSRLPGVGDITYLGQRDYSMRLWLDPQKLAAYNLNAAGRDQRRAGAEHPGGGRPDRPAADADRPGVAVHHHHARPAGEHRPVRQHHPQEQRQLPGLSEGRGQHRAGRPVLRPDLHARRQAVGGPVGLPAARLQRPGGRRAGQGADEAAEGAFPARHRLRHRLRHHAVHQRVDQRGLRDAVRRDRPGGRGRAGVPAELALGADPADRRAGGRSSAPSPSWRPWASA